MDILVFLQMRSVDFTANKEDLACGLRNMLNIAFGKESESKTYYVSIVY